MTRIAVLGAGAWGIAFASVQCYQGNVVKLWARDAAAAASRVARLLPPGSASRQAWSASGSITSHIAEAVNDADLAAIAVPSVQVRDVCTRLACVARGLPVITLAKGLESATGQRPSEIVAELLAPAPGWSAAVLSGATPASDVARGVATSAVLATADARGGDWADTLSGDRLRLASSRDVVGVELAGAIKNLVVLLDGVASGLALSQHRRARMIGQLSCEAYRLVETSGGSPATLLSAAGIPDLLETMLGGQSRNHRVGARLGRGEPIEQVLVSCGGVCEGLNTALALPQLPGWQASSTPLLRFAVELVSGSAPASLMRSDAVLDDQLPTVDHIAG